MDVATPVAIAVVGLSLVLLGWLIPGKGQPPMRNLIVAGLAVCIFALVLSGAGLVESS